MKYTFTLLSLFVALQLFGQTDFTRYEKLIRDIATYGANPQFFSLENNARAGSVLTHNLDSVVTRDAASNIEYKQIIFYNKNGTTKTIDEYIVDSATTELRLQSIYTFTYAGLASPNNLLVESYNEDTQAFEETIGITLSYDGNERVDSVIVTLPDPLSGDFGPLLGLKYVYVGDLLVQARQWYYISLFGSWFPASFVDFQYDGQDRLVDQITSILDFDILDLVLDSRTTYSYNAEGLTDTINRYNYDDPSWLQYDRDVLTYHNNGTMASDLLQGFNGSQFVNNTLISYPVENVVDQYPTSTYLWNLLNNTWEVYDSTNNLLNPGLEWSQVAAPRELSVLSVLGSLDESVAFFSDGPVTDEIHYFQVDTMTLLLEADGKDYYYYSLRDGSGVSDVLPEYIAVTPNPAQEQFIISLDQNIKAEYVVYAVNGIEKVRGLANQGTNYILTSSWLKGMYYVLITLEDGSTFAHKQLIQ